MNVRIPYKMTSSERKVMMDEINRQIAEKDKQYTMEVDATVLWSIYVHFSDIIDITAEELKSFWNTFTQEHKRLRERYELPEKDTGWLYSQMLKNEFGIDLEEWYKESEVDGKK